MRMQLAVQRRRIHQHNRAQQVGRNVVAEVHNRRAARRQRPRAGGLVSTRRYRVIGRNGEPVLVNRQVASSTPPGSEQNSRWLILQSPR